MEDHITVIRQRLGTPVLSHSRVGVFVCLPGGGAWNHALYFKHLAPNTSANTNPSTSISPALLQAIQASFGSVTAMQDAVRAAALKVFGSGWAWVCYTGECGWWIFSHNFATGVSYMIECVAEDGRAARGRAAGKRADKGAGV